MNDVEFLELVMQYQDNSIAPSDLVRLEEELSLDPLKRRIFSDVLFQATALQDQFRQEAFCIPERPSPGYRRLMLSAGRGWAAVAMLLLGLVLGGSAVWAMSSRQLAMTVEDVSTLINGGFEANAALPTSGFPKTVGVWSGDRVEFVGEGAKQGSRRLRFVEAQADTHTQNGRAIACDLFQIVDLRGLKIRQPEQGTSVLELTAQFFDARPENTNPSVSFFCHVFLFRGDPTLMHQTWPQDIRDAVASGSATTTTLGNSGWRNVTAKCLVSPEADFAVIHISALPNLRVPMPDLLFADDVRLVIKTQPMLPVTEVRR